MGVTALNFIPATVKSLLDVSQVLGLRFSATRPVEDELGAHPLAGFVIAAITRGRLRDGCLGMQTRVNSG